MDTARQTTQMKGFFRGLGVSVFLLALASPALYAKEPDRIEVQHVLIGFSGTLPGKSVTRSKAEAEKLANEIFKEAKKKDTVFDKLVEKSDDGVPGQENRGKYKMANKGITPKGGDEYPRKGMVPAFGDVGFKLKVGQVGLAKYDKEKSPFGYHIIKRLK